MRQITEAIRQRQLSMLRYQGRLLEWQTKHLVRAVVAAVPIEKGKQNPLLPLIDEVKLIDEDAPAPQKAEKVETVDKAWTPDDEPLALRRAREGPAGEAERFMRLYGRGGRKG